MSTTIDLRKKNTLLTLKTIMEGDSITKADVANKTGLTLMTVNTIMNSLMKKAIITDCGVADSSSGRKATLYTVNPAAHNIIGVNIDVGTITFAVSDFNLRIREAIVLETNNNTSPEETIDLILKTIVGLIKNHCIKPASILGVGVTVPGPVDEISGVIHSFPNLKGWANIPLKDVLKEKLDIPVFVEKDNYASVLYLKRNLDNTYKNVVSLTIKGGIGTGILLGGRLFRGENGIAGEIGHVSVDMDGPRCNCGNFGCLEIYASDYAIIKNVKNSIEKGVKSGILCVNDDEIDHLDIDKIIEAALNGDELCRDTILKAAEYVGLAVSNAIKFYDPGYFIINSRWIKEIKEAHSIITDITKERCTLVQNDKINLAFFYEKDVYLMGALKLVREHVIANTYNNRLIS